MSGLLGHLLLKNCRVWGWLIQKLFNGYIFCFLGHLVGGQLFELFARETNLKKKSSVFTQKYVQSNRNFSYIFSIFSLLEGVNLLVSSGTASAIAGDRLRLVKRKTARQDDTKVWCIKFKFSKKAIKNCWNLQVDLTIA